MSSAHLDGGMAGRGGGRGPRAEEEGQGRENEEDVAVGGGQRVELGALPHRVQPERALLLHGEDAWVGGCRDPAEQTGTISQVLGLGGGGQRGKHGQPKGGGDPLEQVVERAAENPTSSIT